MGEGKEAWGNNVGLVTLLYIEWKELDHGFLVEFVNTFVIKGFDIYFGRESIVYVISKHMMTNAFRVCHIGYIEDSKLEVNEQTNDGEIVV
jgi:hypothetical protein